MSICACAAGCGQWRGSNQCAHVLLKQHAALLLRLKFRGKLALRLALLRRQISVHSLDSESLSGSRHLLKLLLRVHGGLLGALSGREGVHHGGVCRRGAHSRLEPRCLALGRRCVHCRSLALPRLLQFAKADLGLLHARL